MVAVVLAATVLCWPSTWQVSDVDGAVAAEPRFHLFHARARLRLLRYDLSLLFTSSRTEFRPSSVAQSSSVQATTPHAKSDP